MVSLRQARKLFRWSNLPRRRRYQIMAGTAVASVTAVFEYKFQECIDVVGNPAQVTSPHALFWWRVFFGRTRARWAGSFGEVFLPVTLRAPTFRLYAWWYGADLDEVRYPLDTFRTLNEFFCRPLREGVRPIAAVPAGLVSPVDGEILTIGVIQGPDARVEQVKGSTFSAPAFLGVDPAELTAEGRTVHYVVLYMAPGNYHRMHSPCELTFSQGRHFCGELLPMRKSWLKRLDDVFAVNERVVLSGSWRYGQMHFVAVAAANVGNIFLDFDERLKTNRMRDICVHCGGDISSKLYPAGVRLRPGDNLGGFRLGSSVVLVFDAPADFQLRVGVGDTVKVGEPLGASSA